MVTIRMGGGFQTIKNGNINLKCYRFKNAVSLDNTRLLPCYRFLCRFLWAINKRR